MVQNRRNKRLKHTKRACGIYTLPTAVSQPLSFWVGLLRGGDNRYRGRWILNKFMKCRKLILFMFSVLKLNRTHCQLLLSCNLPYFGHFQVCYRLRKFPVFKRQYSGTGKPEPEAQKRRNIPVTGTGIPVEVYNQYVLSSSMQSWWQRMPHINQ